MNWDVQRQVWDYLFGKEMYQVTSLGVCIQISISMSHSSEKSEVIF